LLEWTESSDSQTRPLTAEACVMLLLKRLQEMSITRRTQRFFVEILLTLLYKKGLLPYELVIGCLLINRDVIGPNFS
jgi:hypothetical protein